MLLAPALGGLDCGSNWYPWRGSSPLYLEKTEIFPDITELDLSFQEKNLMKVVLRRTHIKLLPLFSLLEHWIFLECKAGVLAITLLLPSFSFPFSYSPTLSLSCLLEKQSSVQLVNRYGYISVLALINSETVN